MRRVYYVYILSSRSRQLYVGMTCNPYYRVQQHRAGKCVYTARYRIHRLVYLESMTSVHTAIAREKQVKDGTRARRVALIEGLNPAWNDLAEAWFDLSAARPSALG
jgi:putative endonuclease